MTGPEDGRAAGEPPSPPQDRLVYGFGPFRLRASDRSLFRSGEPIRITPFNKTVALANCLTCHGDFVSLVNHEGQTELEDCTRCHASIGHDEIGVGKP